MAITGLTEAELQEAAAKLLQDMKTADPPPPTGGFAPSSAHGAAVPQETGTERVYDKTQLSMLAGMNLMRIHRDYLAHAIRYEFLVQRIKQSGGDAMVLDVGCADVPLMRAMRSSMLKPKLYFGVDVRPNLIKKVQDYYSTHHVHFPHMEKYLDFTEADPALLKMDWTQIVCLEVIEHMPQGRGMMLLENLFKAASQGGKVYLSTPCFNGSNKAKHHKFEWYQSELEDAIIKTGFKVQNVWGTFANIHDLKRVLTPEERVVWDKMAQSNGGYWGPIAMSLIFSPLHPEAARNAIWELTA